MRSGGVAWIEGRGREPERKKGNSLGVREGAQGLGPGGGRAGKEKGGA